MRTWVAVVAFMGAVSSAQAADFMDLPVLRGSFRDAPAPQGNWDRWYAGGQFGYTGANLDFSHASASLTDYMLRNGVLQNSVHEWSLLEGKNASGIGFGGFVGRNWQWEDAVIGFEVNYSNLRGIRNGSNGEMYLAIINPPGDTPPDGHTYRYNTRLSGSATGEIKDALTLRARAGWDAGTFMPYMFGGIALGRVNVSRTATLDISKDDINVLPVPVGSVVTTNVTPNPATKTEGGVDSITGGYTVGLGTEMLVAGNLFLRAEWEYIRLLKVKDVAFSMNSARVGVGYRF
ncbi:outer membrane beta-barrel protein [Tardiphaga sp.]|uniref:outer membrane protein n=1 Tax=Tardiphaga sp. TaxID=1926292 RepID=UPI0026396D1B|nr:outer membrane beta-barrel protein [Tardiphaga sp.]MDB5618447.1 porin family protein [Tardiphaga sp.]